MLFRSLCLGLVKRVTEVTNVPAPVGRGYDGGDLQTLVSLSSSAGLVAVLVLGLYVSSPEVTSVR